MQNFIVLNGLKYSLTEHKFFTRLKLCLMLLIGGNLDFSLNICQEDALKIHEFVEQNKLIVVNFPHKV